MMNAKKPVFHQGEIAIQKRLGVAERMDSFGRMVIRDHMPRQHQQFYQSLPMLFVGHADQNNQVWASVLTSGSQMITSNNNQSLSVNTRPFKGDPLNTTLQNVRDKQQTHLKVGVLGIELETRRRNRLSGQVSQVSENGFEVDVLQTFGNCPQYIQSRRLSPAVRTHVTPSVIEVTELNSSLSAFIEQTDTFFVASSSGKTNIDADDETQGADVSHRGGRPGFIKVESNTTLTIPDYLGNNHFNTLGNFLINPRAGLLFIDFQTGDVITLTGKAEILWDDPRQQAFKGAERLWQFTLEKGYILKSVMPWHFEFKDWSPNSKMTGTWSEAETIKHQNATQPNWQKMTVSKIEDESEAIRSFYLTPEHGVIPPFTAGQYATIKTDIEGKCHIRNYSISGSPLDEFLRISVKRDGLLSQWLHDNLQVHQTLNVKLPGGNFVLTESEEKPAVLLSAGVGITPMVAMFRHIVKEGIRTRNRRPVIMINTFRKQADIAFYEEVTRLSEDANDTARVYWLLTQPGSSAQPGVHYSAKGRLTQQILQSVLPLGKYDFYLCGPASFMQQTYDLLLALGVQDDDIKAEAFGPAILKRKSLKAEQITKMVSDPIAETAVITFSQSGVEQAWSKEDGSLLEFAESHGLSPGFSCRSGTCGSCKVTVLQGKVTHHGVNSFPIERNEALLCCAAPAKTSFTKSSSVNTPERLVIDL